MSEHFRSPDSMKREVSADGGRLVRTLVDLWPYIWPSDRPDLQRRGVGAGGVLGVAQPPTIPGAFPFKFAPPRPPPQQRRAGRSPPPADQPAPAPTWR